ncbi:MAG: ketopantoate reductase family protein, partial [Firmicutes bacterium]|nr:ketopantoate reductase family protein [Bacillota bacterium]
MRIAMIGMGAVGSVFGMDLYNAYPNDFFAIASGSRYDRLQAEGLQVNDARYPLRVERPAEDVAPAEVIFVCVKNYGLADALDDMRPFVGDG